MRVMDMLKDGKDQAILALAAATTLFGAVIAAESPASTAAEPPKANKITLGQCGLSGNVLFANNGYGNSRDACAWGNQVVRVIAAGGQLTLAPGNGWFTGPDREACIALPPVTNVNGQGYIAAAGLGPAGQPQLEVYTMHGQASLPEVPLVSATVRILDGRIVAEPIVPGVLHGGPEPVGVLAASCK